MNPFNLRPFRYSHAQKEVVEQIIEELLKASIIRPSSSTYASLIMLVKKKDDSWWFYIDYRKWNFITIKNRYLIHIIEDLLDES